jgi:hypothetical protein
MQFRRRRRRARAISSGIVVISSLNLVNHMTIARRAANDMLSGVA